jgi:UPF0755 protein
VGVLAFVLAFVAAALTVVMLWLPRLREVRVTIPEGKTRHEIGALLERKQICSADAFVAASEEQALLRELGLRLASAEGYLFPDTYHLRRESDARALVRRFVANAQRRFAAVVRDEPEGLAHLQRTLDWDLHDAIVLASIVEKEAGVAEERATIAGVFLNRLTDPNFRPRRLQADPTVVYGCKQEPAPASCASFDGRRITRTMLGATDNPYNTYRHEGLPPGPIANPGAAALRAVLAPAQHRFLYFVAVGGGRHTFSVTLPDHLRAVQQRRSPDAGAQVD